MKNLFFNLILFVSCFCHAQNKIFIDTRDNKEYRITSINGTTWMLDNLDYETPLSEVPPMEQKERHGLEELTGRYYHFEESEKVCPQGWRLASVEDWNHYFRFLVETRYPDVELEISTNEKPHHHVISGYTDKLDVFEKDNPLDLIPVGRIEGDHLSTGIDPPFADYWTYDPHSEHPGRTHAHVANPWTAIHAHKHHLKAWQKKKLRKFMIRCVMNSN